MGLGNPGPEYAGTRHNAGFMVLERLANKLGAQWAYDRIFNARLSSARSQEKRVLLCCPETYMNLSGQAVAPIMNYYRVPLENLLVVADDADLPLGCIRMRPMGGTGGHHGLESIHQHLGTDKYARLRIGIGRQADSPREITSHVLGKFTKEELDLLELVLERATNQVLCWLNDGIKKAMNNYNGFVKSQL